MRVLLCLLLCVASSALMLNTEAESNLEAESSNLYDAGQSVSPEIDERNESPDSMGRGGKHVVMTIFVGKQAVNPVSWLYSLKMKGRWNGDTVIVTEDPDCLKTMLENEYLLGEQYYTDEHLSVFGPPTHSRMTVNVDGKVYIVKAPSSASWFNLEKSKAWSFVERARIPYQVGTIVWLDADVVVRKPMVSFLTYTASKFKAKGNLAIFRGPESGTSVMLFFFGDHADECLEGWEYRWTFKSKHMLANQASMSKQEILHAERAALSQAHACKAKAPFPGLQFMDSEFIATASAANIKEVKAETFVFVQDPAPSKTVLERYLGIPAASDKSCFAENGL